MKPLRAFAALLALLIASQAWATSEIIQNYISGRNLYAIAIINAGESGSGTWWNGSAFVTRTAVFADFDLTVSEAVASTGQYELSLPTAAAFINKSLIIQIWERTGGSPGNATTDIHVATHTGYWNGLVWATSVNQGVRVANWSVGGGGGSSATGTVVVAGTHGSLESNVVLGASLIIRDNAAPANFVVGRVTAFDADISELTYQLAAAPGFTISANDLIEVGLPTFDEIDREMLDSGGFHTTTLASVPTSTTATLTSGPPDNTSLVRSLAIFIDQSNPLQKCFVPVTTYVGSTRTITLHEAPSFALAAGDTVKFVPAGLTVGDIVEYDGSELEQDIEAIDAGMGSATAVFDNARVVQTRVIPMSDRDDATTIGEKPARMRVGEKFKFWLDMEDVIGDGVWIEDVENPVSSSPSQLVVTSPCGVNRELVVVELDAEDAIVGAVYYITCDVIPETGETVKAKFEVRIASD